VLTLLLSMSILTVPTSPRANAAYQRVGPEIERRLLALESAKPLRVFLRVYKHERELEVWVKSKSEDYVLYQSYPICAYSGELGPKTREGDMQAPEGIYQVRAGQLNPWSQFHLSFNLGYPNVFERAQGYTGSALMVHGNCVSIGCYAMTDAKIEEIYSLVSRALSAGQSFVPIHAFPFRMNADNRARFVPADEPTTKLWDMLAPIEQVFDKHKRVPNVRITAQGYVLETASK
jgi:murein L,D-transpeptidase YafK